jgi:L,D-transpeptidase YbiS
LAIFAALSGAGYYLARGTASPSPAVVEDPKVLRAENQKIAKKVEKLRPKGLFLVIDTARNRLAVHDEGRVVREVVVSCGSGGVLEDPKGGRSWVFDTPRGERQVKSKARNPTWIKPDWAFIEEGEAIPKKYDDRAEEGVLGDYALGIGNGYFLHGTLYTRLLGRNVTHGCVRIGDADLEYLYKSVPLGTKVYLF